MTDAAPTPRTDAATNCPELWDAKQGIRNGNEFELVCADFARQLERDLAAAEEALGMERAAFDVLRKDRDELERMYAALEETQG